MKPAGARTKGLRAEAQARDFLRGWWPEVERIPPGVAEDRGDLSGVPKTTVQVKHYADIARAYREALASALEQQSRTGSKWAAGIIRPPGTTDAANWRVVMTLVQWADLVAVATR